MTNDSKHFMQGYVCAVAEILRTHESATIAADVLSACKPGNEEWYIIADEDYKILKRYGLVPKEVKLPMPLQSQARRFKIGTKVLIKEKAEPKWWTSLWVPEMDANIGKTGVIVCVESYGIIVRIPSDNGFCSEFAYPYTSLKKVKDANPNS